MSESIDFASWPIGDKRLVDGVWVQCDTYRTSGCSICIMLKSCENLEHKKQCMPRTHCSNKHVGYYPCDPPEVGDTIGWDGQRFECIDMPERPSNCCDDCHWSTIDDTCPDEIGCGGDTDDSVAFNLRMVKPEPEPTEGYIDGESEQPVHTLEEATKAVDFGPWKMTTKPIQMADGTMDPTIGYVSVEKVDPLPPCACGGHGIFAAQIGNDRMSQIICGGCNRSTGRLFPEQAARDEWVTIQRALRLGAVTIQLPEPPDGQCWGDVVDLRYLRGTGNRLATYSIDIEKVQATPTPEQIRERSQQWAAEQKPGTVAVYGGMKWFWARSNLYKWISPSFENTSDPQEEHAQRDIEAGTWQLWPDRLDGIGPEHVKYDPTTQPSEGEGGDDDL